MPVIGRPLTLLVLAVALLFFISTYYRSSSSVNIYREPVAPVASITFEHNHRTGGRKNDVDASHRYGGHRHGSSQFPYSNEEDEDYREWRRPAPTKEVSLAEYMKDMLKWERPRKDGHFPGYQDYVDRDYDPNRWEGFETDRGFYHRTGSKQFEESHSTFERVYSPYPDYYSDEYRRQFHGEFNACQGPRGRLLNESLEDAIHVYDSVPNGFPQPFTGSAEAIALHGGMCMDRAQRYGPYGYGPLLRTPRSVVHWKNVKWGQLQQECVEKNQDRFTPRKAKPKHGHQDLLRSRLLGDSWKRDLEEHDLGKRKSEKGRDKKYVHRTAVLIRTWEGYEYTENDIMAIRALVTELSLQSGGEYQVFLFVNVKDRSQPFLIDEPAYQQLLREVVPEELRDIAVLWSEEICERMYPDVGDWQVYWQQFMPVQWFSEIHPEFEYIWNWEMDVRYIGNHYHFLTQIAKLALQQPRKYLWERNARIYIPDFHGSDYQAYVNATNAIIESAAASGTIPKPVWGPQPYSQTQKPLGPKPPRPVAADDFAWGVGEEADFISLLPIWDPANTSWTMRNKVWNFTPGIRPQFSGSNPTDDGFNHPNLRNVPRRGYINTVVRLSKRLLHAMHVENLAGRSMQAEMWPSTVALHHGFKAVYVPQPIYSAKKWPARYADAVFNADGGIAGRWGQEADSIYNQDREVNFRPWSWYYHAEFPRVLYRRYMGWKATDGLGELGGPEWEKGGDGPGGRMCLPPMLLHPVKRRDLESQGVV